MADGQFSRLTLTVDRQVDPEGEPELGLGVVSAQGDAWTLARLLASPAPGFAGTLRLEVNPGSGAPGGGTVAALSIDEQGRVGVAGTIDAAAYEQGGRPLVASRWSEVPGGIAFAGGNVGIGPAAPAVALHVSGNLAIGPGARQDPGYLTVSTPSAADRRAAIQLMQGTRPLFEFGADHAATGGHDFYLYDNESQRHRLVVDTAGKIGIGTTAPGEQLDVAGRIKAGPLSIGPWPANPSNYVFFGVNTLNQGAAGNYALLQGVTDGPGRTFLNSPTDIRFRIQNADRMVLTNTGLQALVPLHVAGVARVNVLQLGGKWQLSGVGDGHGNDGWLRLFNQQNNNYFGGLAAGELWTAKGQLSGSDARRKRDIEPLDAGVMAVRRLRGVTFRWTDEPAGARRRVGLLAQEVEAVLPELVAEGPDGLKAIDYQGLVALLLECAKAQAAKLETFERALAARGGLA